MYVLENEVFNSQGGLLGIGLKVAYNPSPTEESFHYWLFVSGSLSEV
jgi:hypothetical protein